MLSMDGGVIKSYVEAPSPKGISNTPFFIGSEDDEWNCPGTHGPEFWDAELPVAEHLEKQCLKLVIDFVDFVYEKYARFLFVQKRPK